MKKRSFPLPEAIDGANWTIDVGAASVDLRARRMLVPLEDTDGARFVRAHEMAHAKITPRVSAGATAAKYGVSMLSLQVCEDRRVHEFLQRRGVPVGGGLSAADCEEVAAAAPKMSDRDIAAALVGSHGTGDYRRLMEAVACKCDENTADRVLSIAKLVGHVCEMLSRSGKRTRIHSCTTRAGFRSATIPAARAFDGFFPETDENDPDAAAAEAGVRRLAELAAEKAHRKPNRWGSIDAIERARMSAGRRQPQWRGRRSMDCGAVPVAVHRLTTDGRIFARQLRNPGGTVLIDVSGSMSLGAEDLTAMVHAAPGSTVAIYSGDDCSRVGAGRLAIVANRGQRSTAAEIRGLGMPGGNVVDGPALQWLATQPAPRVWVCDGIVTGVHDRTAPNLFADAARICRRGGIRRVDRPRDAAAMLAEIHRRRRD
jgi:hypothetical protein